MKEWFASLSVLGQVYLWLAAAATLFLIVQIVLLCFSSFGGDVDLDGDGDIDVDTDSGVSIFTVKGVTAFFAVGGWAGLLTCSLVADNLQWLSIVVALVAGGAAMAVVALIIRAMLKLQCNGALQTEKLVGKRATVYVTIPASRGGRGKITLNAQGKYVELDAVTDGTEKLVCDEIVEIVATENECTVVKRVAPPSEEDEAAATITVMNTTNLL